MTQRRRPVQREKFEQANGVRLLRMMGAAYVLGHPSPNDGRRHRGTGQTPGLPDVIAFLPRRDGIGPSGAEVLLVWEVKAAGGRLRADQVVFRDHCALAEVAHVAGGYDALIAWLAERGYVKPESFPHYRQPKGAA